jgi:acyl dehydratase
MKDWVKEILWQLGFIAFVFVGGTLFVWFLVEAFR